MLPLPYDPGPVPATLSNPNHPLMRWARNNGITSLSELAETLDVSKSRLSQIVARKNRPNADLLLKIVKRTSIGLEDLLELTTAEVRAGVVAGWAKRPRKRVAK